MVDYGGLALCSIRGRIGAALKFVLFQGLLFALMLLGVLTAANVGGSIENQYINSVSARTMQFSCPEGLLIERVKQNPLIQSAEQKDGKLTVIVDSAGDKKAAAEFLNTLDCWEYVDSSVEDTSGFYQTVSRVFTLLAAVITAFGCLLLALFVYRSVNQEAKVMAVLKAVGYRSRQIFLLLALEQGIFYLFGFALGIGVMELMRIAFFDKAMGALFGLSDFALTVSPGMLGAVFLLLIPFVLLGVRAGSIRCRNRTVASLFQS